MESKQQLLEIISKSENDRCMYLSELFKYIPDENNPEKPLYYSFRSSL